MFDVAEVESRVQQALANSSNNPEDSRQIYLAEIMDWSDYYTENTEASAAEKERVFSSIVRLWLSSTQFEISLHQFKKAVDLYEQAISDPVVGKSAIIFQSYADFCTERKKLSNAQKVYVKALTAGLPASENKTLWENFLGLMHTVNGSTDMTLAQLQAAVSKQLGDNSASLAPVGVTVKTEVQSDSVMNVVPSASSAVIKTEGEPQQPQQGVQAVPSEVMDQLFQVGGLTPFPLQQPLQQLQDPQQGDVQSGADDLDNVAGLTPEQVIMIYDRRPPMIFSASNKEPMVSGLSALSPSQTVELEHFLSGAKLTSLSSSEGHLEDRQMESISVADKYMDLLEVLWSTQAMKERHFDSWFSDLQMMHIRDESAFLDALSAREPPGTSERELRIRHQAETIKFNNRSAVQKELLNAVINKTLFSLLLEQQTLLSQINFPQFSFAFVDRIKGFLKRQASGSKAATYVAAQNAEFQAICEHVSKQRALVCALLSIRLSVVHNHRNRANNLHRKQLRLSLTRESSLDNSEDVENSPGSKLKKRRVVINQQHGTDSYGHSAVSSYNNGVGSPRYNQHQQLLQQQQAYLMQMQMQM